MDLRTVIAAIASRADDFLAGAANRREARAGIAELITVDYPALDPADREKVTRAVMGILEREGFFEAERSGSDPGSEANNE